MHDRWHTEERGQVHKRRGQPVCWARDGLDSEKKQTGVIVCGGFFWLLFCAADKRSNWGKGAKPFVSRCKY